MTENKKWIVSSILTFLGVLIPILIYFYSIPEKNIKFEILSRTDLVDSLNGIDNMEIIINKNQIKEAYLYIAKFKNIGSEEIAVSDYEKPISIILESEIFSFKIKDITPKNLSLSYSINNNKIEIKPFLFNPDEEFTIEIVTASKVFPQIDSRIAGISKIEESYPNHKLIEILNAFVAFILISIYVNLMHKCVYSSNNFKKITRLISALTAAYSSIVILKSIDMFNSSLELKLIFAISTCIIGILLFKYEQKKFTENGE